MTGPEIDYAAVYRQLPVPVLLLTPDFAVADLNLALVQKTGLSRAEVLGRNVFDAFPDDPSNPGATGVQSLVASLRRVLATGEPDPLEFNRYEFEVSPGMFEKRYWSGVTAPVSGPDGSVVLIAVCGEDVTDRLNRFMSALKADAQREGPE